MKTKLFHKIRGYNELPAFAGLEDVDFLVRAHHAKASTLENWRDLVLSSRIVHLKHDKYPGFPNEQQTKKDRALYSEIVHRLETDKMKPWDVNPDGYGQKDKILADNWNIGFESNIDMGEGLQLPKDELLGKFFNIKFNGAAAHVKRETKKDSRIFYTWKALSDGYDDVKDGTLCLLLVLKSWRDKSVTILNAMLVESFITNYEGVDWLYLSWIKTSKESIKIRLTKENPKPIKSISLTLVCTNTQPYLEFLKKALEHYQVVFKDMKIEYEITLYMFGEKIPDFIDSSVRTVLNSNSFDIVEGKNRSLSVATKDHVLVIDLDCLIPTESMKDLIQRYNEGNHNGIVNIRKMQYINASPGRSFPGIGLYIGERWIWKAYGYNSIFKFFWFEDSEFFMNLSRIGITPHVYFIDFDYQEHERKQTQKKSIKRNRNAFTKILLRGSR